MARRMSRRLVVLSTAAIATVFTVGYVHTQPAAVQLASADSVALPAASATTVTSLALQTGAVSTPRLFRPVATPTSLPTPSSQTTITSTASTDRYRDGSYTGMAENRHGYVQATVVIAGGRITKAAISDCGMQYPCSRIAMLPGEVLTRQSTDTDLVSGATMSCTAYQGAVEQALAKAAV